MPRVFTTREREDLFVKLAARSEGATAPDVYQAAVQAGDKVTPEAYQNLARRLTHRGVLVADTTGKLIAYRVGQPVDGYWLDEEELAGMISDEYPILTLPIWRESQRQIRDIPEEWWAFLRTKLKQTSARELFENAIVSYAQDLQAALELLAHDEVNGATPRDLARMREDARNGLLLLQGLVRFGLGLSIEAVRIPNSVEDAVSTLVTKAAEIQADPSKHPVGWDQLIIRDELKLRIADEAFVVEETKEAEPFLIAAVDGSTRSGVMTFIGEETDFYVGHAPMISINTSIGQVNRHLRVEGGDIPVFLRLPEKPEDVQQRDNKYTVMAKLYYPDLSDAEYMHSLWNAMDVLEAKATLKVLSRWYTSPISAEVPPADVVLRDGTVVPQDRDFSHYRQADRYGEIVRDMISTNWEIVTRCKLNAQTVAGVVKSAQLRVLGPVLNWFVKELAARRESGPLEAWPLNAMNLLPDQILVSRLLCAYRSSDDPWTRTCMVLRPFHATSNYAKRYSSKFNPIQMIEELRKKDLAADKAGEYVENLSFWTTQYRGQADAYVQMLSNTWYGGCFIASVPRLDAERYLPRIEFIVPCETFKYSDPIPDAQVHLGRVTAALRESGFEVSVEHSMFKDRSTLEVLPELVARAHDTVKTWARELLSRVDEYLSALISQHIGNKKARGIRVRPFTKQELKTLHDTLLAERKRMGGATPGSQLKTGSQLKS
jgi:hypothetical protein